MSVLALVQAPVGLLRLVEIRDPPALHNRRLTPPARRPRRSNVAMRATLPMPPPLRVHPFLRVGALRVQPRLWVVGSEEASVPCDGNYSVVVVVGSYQQLEPKWSGWF